MYNKRDDKQESSIQGVLGASTFYNIRKAFYNKLFGCIWLYYAFQMHTKKYFYFTREPMVSADCVGLRPMTPFLYDVKLVKL